MQRRVGHALRHAFLEAATPKISLEGTDMMADAQTGHWPDGTTVDRRLGFEAASLDEEKSAARPRKE
jgi:hypothetical protein